MNKNDTCMKLELRLEGKKFGQMFSFEDKSVEDILIILPHVFATWEKSITNLIREQNDTKT